MLKLIYAPLKRDLYILNGVNVIALILSSVLCVGKKVRRYIYKFRTAANTAMMDEILIMYLLRKRKKSEAAFQTAVV